MAEESAFCPKCGQIQIDKTDIVPGKFNASKSGLGIIQFIIAIIIIIVGISGLLATCS